MLYYLSLSLSTDIHDCDSKYTVEGFYLTVLISEAWNSVGDTVCVLEPQ